jgi:hypothetical protein
MSSISQFSLRRSRLHKVEEVKALPSLLGDLTDARDQVVKYEDVERNDDPDRSESDSDLINNLRFKSAELYFR